MNRKISGIRIGNQNKKHREIRQKSTFESEWKIHQQKFTDSGKSESFFHHPSCFLHLVCQKSFPAPFLIIYQCGEKNNMGNKKNTAKNCNLKKWTADRFPVFLPILREEAVSVTISTGQKYQWCRRRNSRFHTDCRWNGFRNRPNRNFRSCTAWRPYTSGNTPQNPRLEMAGDRLFP